MAKLEKSTKTILIVIGVVILVLGVLFILSPKARQSLQLALNPTGAGRGPRVELSRSSASTGTPPGVTTLTANGITPYTAYLTSKVIGNNLPTTYWFKFGTNSSMSQTTYASPVSFDSLDSWAAGAIALSGLQPGTLYYFQGAAQNSAGTSYGSVMTFTTNPVKTDLSPKITATSVYGITANSAGFMVNLDDNGIPTAYWIKYGTNSSMSQTSTSANLIGVGNPSYPRWGFGIQVGNLSPNTLYYFQAVAQNSAGTSYGSVMTFTTAAR